LAVLMPEADRAQGEPFDRTLGLPAVDIFPDAECVVGQIKNPRDDVAYKGLAAKGDRETEYRGACDDRRDVDVEIRQYHERRNEDDCDAECDAQDGCKCFKSRGGRLPYLRVAVLTGSRCGRPGAMVHGRET